MFIVSPATVMNTSALDMRQVPRKFLGRVTLFPRLGVGFGLLGRMIFEAEVLRYTVSLLPFVFGAVVWPQYALAIAQAPLLMFMVIYGVEMRFLRVPAVKRAGLISVADAERGLDLLRVRATTILTRIAAHRGITAGALHLVIEQSELTRIAPLTLVSVQTDLQTGANPTVLRLDAAEVALLREALFQSPLDERQLHLINLSQNIFLRDIGLDVRSVSAHARLAAMMR